MECSGAVSTQANDVEGREWRCLIGTIKGEASTFQRCAPSLLPVNRHQIDIENCFHISKTVFIEGQSKVKTFNLVIFFQFMV